MLKVEMRSACEKIENNLDHQIPEIARPNPPRKVEAADAAIEALVRKNRELDHKLRESNSRFGAVDQREQ